MYEMTRLHLSDAGPWNHSIHVKMRGGFALCYYHWWSKTYTFANLHHGLVIILADMSV